MDKKYKIIIIIAIILIVGIVIVASSMGTGKDENPRHVVVAMHNNIAEPKGGFDPTLGWGCGHQNFNPLVQSTLFSTDENGTIVNDLATGYSISSDGLKWTVNIRDDVKFSDNTTLTASDVAFTFNTAKTSNSELDMTNLESANATDNNTIEFNLKEPRSSFIYDLRYVGIVKEDGYDNGTYGGNPIGSGPYVLKEWEVGQQAIFEVNPNYYGEKPYYTQITLLFPDEASWLELAKSDEVDVTPVPINGLNETIEGYDKISLSAGRAQGISLPYQPDTGITTEEGDPVGNNVTADDSIRKALNVGINRSEIVTTTYSGHGAPEYTGVDSRDYGNPDAIVADENISEAKRILEEGGWKDTDGDGIFEKNGMNASFKLYYPSEYLDRQSLAVSFSEQAKEIGIDVELVGTDWDTIYANMYNSAALMQQTSPDPYKSIYQQYHSKEIDNDYMNPNLYNNSNIDSILEEAMSTTDLNEANSLWAQSAYTNGEGFGPNGDAPWVWVATYNYTYFVNEDININIDRPDNLGNDILINIVKWRPN